MREYPEKINPDYVYWGMILLGLNNAPPSSIYIFVLLFVIVISVVTAAIIGIAVIISNFILKNVPKVDKESK